LRRQAQEALYNQMVQDDRSPRERYAAGEILDESGWAPADLNLWLRCPGCADNRRDLWVMKYPVTNIHFARFMAAGGYEEPVYWGGEDSIGWRWRVKKHPDSHGEGEVTEPRYWRDTRFGKERRGYPVVGVSWYEASAYARWLAHLLPQAHQGPVEVAPPDAALVADLPAATVPAIRVPTETEWVRLAGGAAEERYPWDRRGHPVTQTAGQVMTRANVDKSGIGQTSPVAMYPQGVTVPFGLMDLAGNVWEWTDSWYDKTQKSRVLRGGSWRNLYNHARVSVRVYGNPDGADSYIGVRVVAPVVSDA
jgi:formylglycine-generating enzyme required for sulfatase activity